MPDRKPLTVMLVVWLAASLLGLVRFAEQVHPRYDSGAYIIAARSIAQGQGLSHLAHPQNPPFTTYPPVIPVLLAPFATLGAAGFTGLKAGMIGFFSLTLLAFALTFGRFLPNRRLPWALGLLATGSLLAFAGRIQGEVPFTLFALLVVFFADRFLHDHRWADLAGALASLSLLCNARQAGIAWAAGFVVACAVAPLAVSHRRVLIGRRVVAVVLVLMLIIVPWVLLIHAIQPGSLSPDSSSMLRTDGWDPAKGRIGLLSRAMAGRIKMNLAASATLAPESLFFTYALSQRPWVRALLWPLAALLAVGFGYRAWKKRSVLETTTLAYCALIIITPWLTEPRFFTVIGPLLIVYLAQGVDRVAHGFSRKDADRRAGTAFAALCGILMLVNLIGVVLDDRVNPWSAKNHPDHRLAMFARPHLPPDAIVLAHDHCAFYLLTGRKSLSFTASEQKFRPFYKLDAYLDRGGRVDYIAWTQGDDELVREWLAERGWDSRKIAQDSRSYLHQILR